VLAVASRLSFPGCTVRWTHHVLADEQLALRCHSRGTRLEDLDGLHIRPVVDNVAEEVDLRFPDRGLFEEVQGGKRGSSGVHKLGKVVNEVLSRQISIAINQIFAGTDLVEDRLRTWLVLHRQAESWEGPQDWQSSCSDGPSHIDDMSALLAGPGID